MKTRRLLNKMLLRSFKKAWAQFLAVIAIGAIAVTLFVGLLANANSFENRVNEVYSEGNLASLWVTTTKYDQKDQAAISSLLNDEEEMEGRLYVPATAGSKSVYLVVAKETPKISKPYGELNLSSKSTDAYYTYMDKELANETQAVLSDAFRLDDVVPFYFSLASYGIDEIASYLDSYVKDGGSNIFKSDKLSFNATVTGFMSNPENVTKSSYNTSIVLMSDAMFKEGITKVIDDNFNELGKKLISTALKQLIGFNSLDSDTLTNPNQYLITVKDENRVSELKTKINDYFQSKEENNLYLTTSRSEMPFYVTLNNDVTQARQFTFVFPFVFFAVALLVILTTLSQRVLQERSQIGTMKAIGIKKSQIYFHYMRLTSLLVGIGILIGEILGPIIIPRILGEKYSILYSLPAMKYTFPILEGILTAIAFLGVASLVTFLICHKEVSLKPVDSMRPEPPKLKFKHIRKMKKGKVGAISLRMAFRNIRINKVKSLMVIIGVMGCTALLSCGFGIEDTIDNGISHDLSLFYDTDLNVTYKNAVSYEDATNTLLSYEGIKEVEPYLATTTTTYKIDGAQVETNLRIMQKDGEAVKLDFNHDEVAITQKVAKKGNISVGDTINFQYNNINYEAKVALIEDAFVYHGIYCYTDASFFKDVTSFTYTTAYVKLDDGANPKALKETLEEKCEIVQSATTSEDREAQIQDIMSGVKVMTNAVKVFAILLAIVVLYNLALMNFKERTRDIATLKVLGFSRTEIALSLMFETMSLTAIGVIFGLALGYPFLLAVLGTNIVELVEYLYSITILSYVLSFVLTFVVAFLVNIILVQRTKKVLMVESLKSVE